MERYCKVLPDYYNSCCCNYISDGYFGVGLLLFMNRALFDCKILNLISIQTSGSLSQISSEI